MSEHLCVVCPVLRPGDPRIYERANVCDGCRSQVDALLGNVVDDYARLPDALEPGASNGPKVSGTPSRSLGVRLDPLSLLSPAGAAGAITDPYGDQHGSLPALVVMDQWVPDWIDVRGQGERPPVPTMTELTRWLRNRLEWACDYHPAIDDFAQELSDLSRALASAARTDHGRGEKVGKCPAVMRDDTRCGTALRVDPFVDQIQCGRCGTRWNRRKGEWLKLRAAQLGTGDAA